MGKRKYCRVMILIGYLAGHPTKEVPEKSNLVTILKNIL